MSIPPQLLTANLNHCKSISDLRKYARANNESMDAGHDSVICVACGRFGCTDESIELYLDASFTWLDRPKNSFGRGPREISNILHAGGKLFIDPHCELMKRLLDESVRLSVGFNAQDAANSIWAAAMMGVDDTRVLNALTKACVDRVKEFNAQCASNSIWAIATLGVSDVRIINALAQACVNRLKDFNAQNASNSIWAIATLGVSDVRIIDALAYACVSRVKEFNPQEAANSIWAIATLGVSDVRIIVVLAQACVDRVKDFSAQGAANSIWAIATLGVLDVRIITALAQACVDRVKEFNPQAVSNTLWSAAVFNITDTNITRPLTSAVSERFKSITRFDAAQQCLQAHYSGLTVSDEAVKHFHAIIHAHPQLTSITNQQLAVSSTLTRLGYTPQLEVPVFNGLVTTDIVIEKPSSDGSGRLIKVSIEFDGPTHYLRPAMGSRDQVGPIDARTRIRNALLKRCGKFDVLITIPYCEWNEVQGKKEKEEEYVKKKIDDGTQSSFTSSSSDTSPSSTFTSIANTNISSSHSNSQKQVSTPLLSSSSTLLSSWASRVQFSASLPQPPYVSPPSLTSSSKQLNIHAPEWKPAK